MSRTQITSNSLKDASVSPQKLVSPFNFTGSISALSASIAGNLVVDGDTLFVDSVNNRVGIGTVTPNNSLTVMGNISATGAVSGTSGTFSGDVNANNIRSGLVTSLRLYSRGVQCMEFDSANAYMGVSIAMNNGNYLVGLPALGLTWGSGPGIWIKRDSGGLGTTVFSSSRTSDIPSDVILRNLTASGTVTAANMVLSPSASVTPANNGNLVVEATSDTAVTIKLRGSDGAVRSVVLTLA